MRQTRTKSVCCFLHRHLTKFAKSIFYIRCIKKIYNAISGEKNLQRQMPMVIKMNIIWACIQLLFFFICPKKHSIKMGVVEGQTLWPQLAARWGGFLRDKFLSLRFPVAALNSSWVNSFFSKEGEPYTAQKKPFPLKNCRSFLGSSR